MNTNKHEFLPSSCPPCAGKGLTTPPKGGVWPRMQSMRFYKWRLCRIPDAALRRHGENVYYNESGVE